MRSERKYKLVVGLTPWSRGFYSPAMDVVLEIFDSFLFDAIYATVLPADSTSPVSRYVKSVATATWSSIREGSTDWPYQPQEWSYEPATRFFSIQPSHWAYESSLPRDNPYRQLLTLFLITLYDPSHTEP